MTRYRVPVAALGASLLLMFGAPVGCSGDTPASSSAQNLDTRCGQQVCGLGSECCDESCGVCRRSGVCEEMCVIGRCTAQRATATGDCEQVLGVRWTGRGCEALVGCECSGEECGSLYGSLEACESYNSACSE